MKKTELRKLVKEAIQDIIKEADISPAEKAAKDAEMKAIDAKIKALQTKKGDLSSGREEVAEGELDEMANVGIKYVVSPDADMSKYKGKYNKILTTLQDHGEPVTKLELVDIMGLKRQQQINTEFMQLVNIGAIVQADTEFQKAKRVLNPKAKPEPMSSVDIDSGDLSDEDLENILATSKEKEEEEEEEPEEDTGIINRDLSDEEVDAMFAATTSSGDEPDVASIEKTDIDADTMSDDDYEAFMQYTDLESRLSKVKNDILRVKRSKKTVGDIADKPGSEMANLKALKDRLQSRINDLLASSEYLRKRKAKSSSSEEDEETLDESLLDDWTKSQLQYYAGIKP
jgi:hypothetical protein